MPAATPSTDFEAALDRDGYVVLDRALDADDVDALRAFLTAALHDHARTPTSRPGIRADSALYDAVWPDFYDANPDWFHMFCNDRVVDALHQLLGEPFVLTRDSIAQWSYFPGWHTDTTTTEARGELAHLDPDWRMLTVGTYLQTGGGLAVIPGSHRRPDPFVAMRTQRDRHGRPLGMDSWRPEGRREVPLGPGDVVIFDMRLIHGAAASMPRDERGERCQKIALFSRVSRNVPAHVAAYSDFRFNGSGARDEHLGLLRERARALGFLVD